jgi:hypothetical protein
LGLPLGGVSERTSLPDRSCAERGVKMGPSTRLPGPTGRLGRTCRNQSRCPAAPALRVFRDQLTLTLATEGLRERSGAIYRVSTPRPAPRS